MDLFVGPTILKGQVHGSVRGHLSNAVFLPRHAVSSMPAI